MKHGRNYVILIIFLLNFVQILSVNTRRSQLKSSMTNKQILALNTADSSHAVSVPLPPLQIHHDSPFFKPLRTNQPQIATVTELGSETGVELTLPELKIDENKKIESFYPYFYKTHIIEYQDSIDYKHLTNDCRDPLCEWCDLNTKMTCQECRHGFFLFNEKCYSSCPDGYVADVFQKKCIQIGTCKNICGGQSIDCSCHHTCAASGSCCSDYQDCEILVSKNSNRKTDCNSLQPNCELCDFGEKVTCSQCSNGFFLRNGECVNSCFASDRLLLANKICKKNQDCRVENCEDCVEGNPAVCKKCSNGFYMHNNQCLASCPLRYRADRISWICLEAPVFAWYWVFPSISSCSKRCGQIIAQDADCSCSDDCFRYGNCCQDIEDFCPQMIFWK